MRKNLVYEQKLPGASGFCMILEMLHLLTMRAEGIILHCGKGL